MIIKDKIIPILQEMLTELKNNQLTTELTPAREGDGKVRVAVKTNPKWYSNLCSAYPAPLKQQGTKFHGKALKKKPRTLIKRQYIILIMERMIKNKESISRYAIHILDEAESRLGYYEEHPDNIDWRAEIYGS